MVMANDTDCKSHSSQHIVRIQ
uniref:Uncharacterized protein n=1 Tax=Anguilla anguilla TaxID=7936 RepID=A0A0E9RF85_ANGAN